MNPKVDFYFNKPTKWQSEISKLRTILLDIPLEEDLKWGVPCYLFKKDKIVLIHTFKEYCAVLFFKGVLLKDTEKILVQQTKNVQGPRQIRFANLEEIVRQEKTLRTYVYEAIEVEKAGLKVELKKTKEYEVPEEFQEKLDELPTLNKAFHELTPGRQRGYLLYFSVPKQSKTRQSRVEKYKEAILEGKGLND